MQLRLICLTERRKVNKNEQNLRDLGDTIKDINKCIIEASEKEESEKEPETIFEKK